MGHSSTPAPGPASAAAAPALRRGLALLRAIARDGGSTPSALAQRVRMPRATLYRLLAVLVDEGWASVDPPGRYRGGPRLAELAPAHRDLVADARPVLERLAAALGESVKLVLRDGHEAVTVAAVVPRDNCIAARVGTRMPLHVGASQRLLLAHAPAAVREGVLAGPLERRTRRTIVSPERLRRDLEALGRRREVASHGEGIDGVGATAALVGRPGREPLAALVAVYVYASQSARSLARLRRAVAEGAAAIGRASGAAE